MANPVHNARPNLREIAPLTFMNIILFIWLNLFIAYSIYHGRPNPTLVLVSGIFNSYFWVVIFVSLSLGHAYGLLKNDWRWLRRFLAIGLFAKALITYSLLVLGHRTGYGNIIGVTALWVGITWVQFFTLKYFNKTGIINGGK